MTDAASRLACHHCGAVFRRVALEKNHSAICSRCDTVLEVSGVFTAGSWVAIVIATMMTFILANAYPVGTLIVQGTAISATFLDAVIVTWHAGYPAVALLTAGVGFLLPALHLCLLLWVLGPLAMGRLPLFFEGAVHLIDRLKPWCMVPVFLLGALVAIVKLVDLATLHLGIGLFATLVAAVLITSLSRLDAEKLRHMAHDLGIDVAHAPLAKPPSPAQIKRTWALLMTAVVLYIPANLLPIMYIDAINGSSGHTIMGGVIELWQMGSWDIALVVFIASVFVPMLKLLSLGGLVWLTQIRSNMHLKTRTKAYAMVEFIGQWSMLDVFVVILLSALGKFGNLLNISPGAGAAAFGGVVVVTMIAAMGFDPRLAWRRAGHRRHIREENKQSATAII